MSHQGRKLKKNRRTNKSKKIKIKKKGKKFTSLLRQKTETAGGLGFDVTLKNTGLL
jgi:hypothetical protein